MSYHGFEHIVQGWNKEEADQKEQPDRQLPKVQIISPQKQLYDIQQVLNNLSEQSVMTALDLKVSIQRILDGEV